MTKDYLLYGKSGEENIVAVEQFNNQNIEQIFKRVDGKLISEFRPYKFIAYTVHDDDGLQSIIENEGVEVIPLTGTNHYDTLVKTNNIAHIYELVDKNIPYKDSQYLLQSGKTLFKGMEYYDPLILYFDLETYTTEGYAFPNSTRDEDEIIIISIHTNKGQDKVLVQEHSNINKQKLNLKNVLICKNEKELLQQFIKTFREIDPDIVANHNIFNFDLPYLKQRCVHHSVKFSIGRNGSEPKVFDTSIKFAEKSKEYTNFSIYGRHVIDTMFLAMASDVVSRDMPSYRLKEIVKYLGKASKERTYILGDDISVIWRNQHNELDVNDLINYALDDVYEAEILFNTYAPATFYMTQMIPMGYQEVVRYGTGNKIEYVFMREYLRRNASYPIPDKRRTYGGGYADILEIGLFNEPIIYADVKSLYPSLAKILNIQPRKDELKIFQDILNLLMQYRFDIKAKIKEYKKAENDEGIIIQKSRDGTVKIFLNTMAYGFLGWEYGSFNDYDCAESITVNGQRIVKNMKDQIYKDGGLPIKIDTDGIALIPPKKYQGTVELENKYCERLTSFMPDGIIIENDGRYAGIFAVDKKNYALHDYDGSIKLKGNALRGRDIEPYNIAFIKECINNFFNNKGENCALLYENLIKKIENYQLQLTEITKRAVLNKNIEDYVIEKETEHKNPIPQYEVVLKYNLPMKKGDTITYYIQEYPIEVAVVRKKKVLRKKKSKIYEAATPLTEFRNDYEPSYYLDRLNSNVRKFVVLGKTLFDRYFQHPELIKGKDKRKFLERTNKKYED